MSGSVVSRERENFSGINMFYYYRILEVSVRDEIITLENEYNRMLDLCEPR